MALRAAGLVTSARDGRNQRYRLDPTVFRAVLAPWLARYEPFWSDALTRLRGLVEGD